ncbi:MAG: ATP phosphoribosyltransferase regulatory subunit, partial [Deltaproteobacteria bacterium]|nr:ATP phosphoribosyltransferase regulatory subunit [Deltaproteobacteria bacterium]
MSTPLVISLPQGVRDILPEESGRITAVESAILSVFARFGYQKVITPLLEYMDSLALGMGGDLNERVMKFIDPATGKVVAIRPDITPQIARIAATKMKDYPLPLKLCYNANVLRGVEKGGGAKSELLQIGAELITARPSPEADAEMIIMAIESLMAAGVKAFKIDVGDVGFLKGVLDRLDVGAAGRKTIMALIAAKDSSGLEAAIDEIDVKKKIKPSDRKLLVNLTTFYGEDEVIEKARGLVTDPALCAGLDRMHNVLDIISKKGYKSSVTIDLGEVRGIDYYTGIIFEGFASGAGRPIMSGGRYDTLLEKYGYTAAATGFAFDVENIVASLARGA